MKHLVMAIAIVSTCMLAACSVATDGRELAMDDGWIRAMPPGSAMAAAYGRLRNTSADELTITAFESNSFRSVSLHQSVTEDGVSRMREVSEWPLEPGSALTLEPGGYHLMLMRPVRVLQPGETVNLTVRLADGRAFTFTLPVESR